MARLKSTWVEDKIAETPHCRNGHVHDLSHSYRHYGNLVCGICQPYREPGKETPAQPVLGTIPVRVAKLEEVEIVLRGVVLRMRDLYDKSFRALESRIGDLEEEVNHLREELT